MHLQCQGDTMVNFHELFPGSGQGKHYDFHSCQLRWTQRQYERPIKILDWGAGKGGTTQWLTEQGFDVTAYDPYWEPNACTERLKAEYDAIITGDVLEHILTKDIPWRYFKTIRHNIHIIDLTPAKKRLPDGRNAHINLQTEDAWLQTFAQQLGGVLRHHSTYTVDDPNFTHRKRLCLHIEL
jgi:2-polyprenyl-3-methyl-5-hydroxy-6-metoxy-1,4-benzoquinol methylase